MADMVDVGLSLPWGLWALPPHERGPDRHTEIETVAEVKQLIDW